MAGVLPRRGEDTQGHTQGEGQVTMEAEMGVLQLHAKERQGLVATPRS